MRDCHINIVYSEENGGHIADIPDLDACCAFGDTPAEAFQEVQKAKDLWLQAARAEGKPIPTPKYRPVIYGAASAGSGSQVENGMAEQYARGGGGRRRGSTIGADLT